MTEQVNRFRSLIEQNEIPTLCAEWATWLRSKPIHSNYREILVQIFEKVAKLDQDSFRD